MADVKKTTPSVSEDPNALRWGFTPQSENWNGRFAMIGFLSGQGILHFWGIL
jgi:hypothetical protein